MVKHGFPALRVLVGGHQAIWLVITPKPRGFRTVDGATIYGDAVLGGDVKGRAFQHHTIDGNATFLDPTLSFTTRAKACTR